MIKKGKHILFECGSKERDNIAKSRGRESFEVIKYDYELVYGNQQDRHTFSKLC